MAQEMVFFIQLRTRLQFTVVMHKKKKYNLDRIPVKKKWDKLRSSSQL